MLTTGRFTGKICVYPYTQPVSPGFGCSMNTPPSPSPRKPSLLLLALLTSLLPLGAALRSPGSLAQDAPEPVPSFTPPASLAAGTRLEIDGSTSMGVINQALAESFESRFPETEILLSSNGGDAALQSLLQGDLELAALGRPLTDEEKTQGLTQVPISREKIAIIVGSDNPFQRDLTSEQFAQIFRGEISNWSELGGPDVPIRFIDRPPSSDTRKALSGYEIFSGVPFAAGANAIQVETDDTAAVVRELGSDGISYAIASQVIDQDNVRVITMHNTLPEDPRYPYSQPRGYVYRGEPSLAVEAFLGFATNADGQQAVAAAKADEAATVATADLLPGVMAISPDGQRLVQGTQDGLLVWYDGQGQPLGQTVPAHSGLVTGLKFAPDGQSLISSSADGTVRRWDLQGNPVGEPLIDASSPITALAVSPDGQQVVAGLNDGTMQRWSADGTAQSAPLDAHQGAVRSLAFSPDGQNLLSSGSDGNVRRWSSDGAALSQTPSDQAGGVVALATSPDGQFFVTGGGDGSLKLWDAAGAPRGGAIAAHTDAISAVAISPDAQTIATAGKDNQLRLWDSSGNAKPLADGALPGPASALSYKPDGDLVAGLAAGSLQLRDPQGQLRAQDEVPVLPGDADAPNLPPEIANPLQNLPRSTWWIVAAIPILLVLTGLLWSLLGGRREAEEERDQTGDDATDAAAGEALGRNPDDAFSEAELAAGTLPASFTDTAAPPSDGVAPADEDLGYLPVSTIPPESAWVSPSADPNEDLSLGSKLAQAQASLAEGTELSRSGHHEDALNAFNTAIEAAEVERMKAIAAGTSLGGILLVLAQATARRGAALALLGRTDRALENFDRALEMDANLGEAWTGKGQLLGGLGRYDEALFCIDKALELDPNDSSAWLSKGQILIQMGRSHEGQACLSRAAALTGTDPLTDPLNLVDSGQTAASEPLLGPVIPQPSPVPPLPLPAQVTAESGFEAGFEQPDLAFEPSTDVPPELSLAAAQLPSAEPVLGATLPLAGPEVPALMQAVVEVLPDAPEMPEHAFIRAEDVNNPDDFDQPVAPATVEVALPAPPVAPPAPIAPPAAASSAGTDDVSLPAPEELTELTEALQASVDLTALLPLPSSAIAPEPIPEPIAPESITPEPAELPAADLAAAEPAVPLDDVGEPAVTGAIAPLEPEPSEPAPDWLEPTTPRPDNPDSALPASDLPPELLADLQRIPADSANFLDPPDFLETADTATEAGTADWITAAVPPSEAEGLDPLAADLPPPMDASWMTLAAPPEEARLYAVWNLSAADRSQAQAQGGEQLAIRLYDVTEQRADGTLPAPIDQQTCYELAKDWYLARPQAEAAEAIGPAATDAEVTYIAEVGYLSSSGDWLAIARSNPLAL